MYKKVIVVSSLITSFILLITTPTFVSATSNFPIVKEIPMVYGSFSIAIDDSRNIVYVANIVEGEVNVIDGDTDEVVDTISIPGLSRAIGVNPVTNKVYVADSSSGYNIDVVDWSSGGTIKQIPIPYPARALTVNSNLNSIYVTFQKGDGPIVGVIDGGSDTLFKYIYHPSSGFASGIVANSFTNRIYTEVVHGTVTMVDGVRNEIITNTPVGAINGGYEGIDINTSTNLVYVAGDQVNQQITVLNGSDDSINARITTQGVFPFNIYASDIATNPTTNHIFVSGLSYVLVLEGSTNEFFANEPLLLGSQVYAIAVNKTTNKVYAVSPDKIYVIHDGDLIPSDEGPEPFLDLPWDYEGEGLIFNQAALNPSSWFDHKYPLQDLPCCDPPVTVYTGEEKNFKYRHHNGYDYNQQDGVYFNTPVLAAASGWATFVPEGKSGGAGNVIKIDHENHYQTWYEHLSSQGLVISSESQKVYVNKGDIVGKVGMTGYVTGPHIHMSVFYDTNGDGLFVGEFPLGVTDPLGWEGNYDDPWPKDKDGAKSYNLFIARAKPKTTPIPTTGGILTADNVTVEIPSGASTKDLVLTLIFGPYETASSVVKSVVPTIFLEAIDNAGDKITQFLFPIHISYDYSQADLSNTEEDTLTLYYYDEALGEWHPISTTIDLANKLVYGDTTHFTQFALMGEVKDTIAPSTEVEIIGDKGDDNWYRSNVKVYLDGKDNEGGNGLQYTLYSLNDSDWYEYQEPLNFEDEGNYQITYQSFDIAGNIEDRESIDFNIDKTLPEAKVYVDQSLADMAIEGVDDNLKTVDKFDNANTDSMDDEIYMVSDKAGNSLNLEVRDRDKLKKDKFAIYSFQYNNAQSYILPSNHFDVRYKKEDEKLGVVDQSYEEGGVSKVRIKYDIDKDLSTVFIKVNDTEKLKETVSGFVLLQLITNKGNLEYSY